VAENLEQKIKDAADGPAAASNDAGSMKQHSLRDLVEADKHLGRRDSAKRKNPFKIQRVRTGGPVQ